MKKLLIVLICLPLFGLTQNITDSLLLYYPLNSNAIDLSGNNFHGTPSGVTSVPDRYGVPNSAYHFDGVNDYIDLPLNDTLKPQFPVTFAFWAKINNPSIAKGEFFTLDFTQNNQSGLYMNVNSQGSIGLAYGGGLGGFGPANRTTFRTNEIMVDSSSWYHITGIVYSESNMDIYINCNNANAIYHSGTAPTVGYSANISGTIGRKDALIGGSAYYYLGYLDEFSFWERALSSAEIYTLCDSLPLINSTQSWDCVNGACVDPGNGSGSFSDSLICVSNCVLPSWDCIANACIDPGNGSGTYTTINSCQAACVSTSVSELSNERKLLRVVDVLGKEVNPKEIIDNTTIFYIYDDGTVEKRIIIE
jgi:hypothetical protein